MFGTGLLEGLAGGRRMDRGEASEAMRGLLDPEVDAPLKSAFLAFLRARGASAEELAGFADAIREQGWPLLGGPYGLIDTCGTGGGAPSFNLSTGAAILAAAAGARVAKHGNRAVTSRCGSADVLEALGVEIADDHERHLRRLESAGIAFLFAPHHYPGLAAVGPLRRQIGFRTVFNQLGPLLNPAGARRQVIGVFAPELGRPMAEAALLLGAEEAWVVHGEDGLDEASPCAPTRAWIAEDGKVRERTLLPKDFGQSDVDSGAIAPAECAEGAALMLRRALSGEDEVLLAALIPNAAIALIVGGLEDDLAAAADRAREAARSGRASAALEALASA
jgi:anthranilate phosphoribosyltransferase